MKEKGSDLKITEEMERKKLQDRYIRFDWAIKRLLRQKANVFSNIVPPFLFP